MTDLLTVTVEIEGKGEEVDIPAGLVDLYREEESESDEEIIADMLVMAFSERAHAIAHHGEGGDREEIEALEAEMMEQFEQRFGVTYGEATGHSH